MFYVVRGHRRRRAMLVAGERCFLCRRWQGWWRGEVWRDGSGMVWWAGVWVERRVWEEIQRGNGRCRGRGGGEIEWVGGVCWGVGGRGVGWWCGGGGGEIEWVGGVCGGRRFDVFWLGLVLLWL